MKDNQNKQLFTELTPEEGANLSGGATELKLNYFEVRSNQEYPRDEPYLKNGPITIWSKGGVGIGNHEVDREVAIRTGGSVTLSLFESDSISKDEFLGSVTIEDGVRGGNLTAEFTRKGAHYILHYDAEDF